jgi:small subunit ribosomal protein S11
MARIAGIDLPKTKRGAIGLTYIYGIGRSSAPVHPWSRPAWTPTPRWRTGPMRTRRDPYVHQREHQGGGRLRSEVQLSIKRLVDINSYRGTAPPQRPARARPAHPHQQPHPQGQAQDRGQQEEGDQVGSSCSCQLPAWATTVNGQRTTDNRTTMAKQQKAKGGAAAGKKKKKNVVVEAYGQAHIRATFNNLIVSLTNNKGEVISWSSGPARWASAAARRTPRTRPGERRGGRTRGLRTGPAQGEGLRERPGGGRESAIRALHNSGVEVTEIVDITPMPHNGCRPPKKAPRLIEQPTVGRDTDARPVVGAKTKAAPKTRKWHDTQDPRPGSPASSRSRSSDRTSGWSASPIRPGQHGPNASAARRRANTACSWQEKQKAKYTYGILERQFREDVQLAASKKGITGEVLLSLCEARLDNTVYRLGIAPTRRAARQLVSHGHITVNKAW